MSGGSYNYLCHQDFPEICEKRSDLADMRDRLTELGFTDAAKETESVILMIDSFQVRIEARIERLTNVWHSVEWFDSSDSGLGTVEQAIKEYQEK
jgi:hypothetical protein